MAWNLIEKSRSCPRCETPHKLQLKLYLATIASNVQKPFVIIKMCSTIFTKHLVDQCLSDPCKNGGTCALDGDGYATCTCPELFTSHHCEEVIGSKYCPN